MLLMNLSMVFIPSSQILSELHEAIDEPDASASLTSSGVLCLVSTLSDNFKSQLAPSTSLINYGARPKHYSLLGINTTVNNNQSGISSSAVAIPYVTFWHIYQHNYNVATTSDTQ